MGTWVLNGTTVKLDNNSNTVAIGADTTPPGRKLEVTGGAARLVLEDRGGEVHNVRAYGAQGNGSDDTVAVNDAIQAAQANPRGGIVYFPPGTYKITSKLGLASDLLGVRIPLQFLGAGPRLSVITTDDPTRNIIHSTVAVPTINDKVEPIIFRDLKFEASVLRTAGAAILQDVIPGSFFQHGIRIENCHFKGQHVGVQLRAASTAVIENCTFWQAIASEADIWVDEQVGGDSTTHLITGCLFADTAGASKAVKLTGLCGGDRVIGNLFVNYDVQVHIESVGATSQLIQGNVMEAARRAAVRLTGADHQIHSVISGNAIRVSSGTGAPSRCIWADLSGAGTFADQMTVVGNKLVGDLAGNGTKGIELAPTAGAATDRWLIAENLFHRLTVAIEASAPVTGLMLGSNAYVGNTTNLVNASTGNRGATFLDRVGIGTENVVTGNKDLHVKSGLGARPRVYLEGTAGVSSPGVEFAFDSANVRRAALVGTAAGSAGVQLELFTKPDGSGPAQRLVVDKDGNALWRSNFQEMVQLPTDPPAPAVGRARLFLRDTGTGKTQFCIRFPTGPVQVLATEP